MKLSVLNKNGEKVQDLAKPDVFDVKISNKALTLYINYLRSTLRAPIANSKNRGEVSGGGRKPWRQKGTGSARVGSSRSPLWVGGGVTFGPTNDQNFRLRLNKTERKNAILSLFSRLLDSDSVIMIDSLLMEKPKTSRAAEILAKVGAEGKVSVIYSKSEDNAGLSFRNIAGVKAMEAGKIDYVYVISSDKVVLSSAALAMIEGVYDGCSAKKEATSE